MRFIKKGFSLTEIIITITIIGILALLGLNYVKRNATKYYPLYYYSAYETLMNVFADAVANNVNLTGVDLCNHMLTIANIDPNNSSCGTANNETSMIHLNEYIYYSAMLDRIFGNFLISPAFAAGVGMDNGSLPGFSHGLTTMECNEYLNDLNHVPTGVWVTGCDQIPEGGTGITGSNGGGGANYSPCDHCYPEYLRANYGITAVDCELAQNNGTCNGRCPAGSGKIWDFVNHWCYYPGHTACEICLDPITYPNPEEYGFNNAMCVIYRNNANTLCPGSGGNEEEEEEGCSEGMIWSEQFNKCIYDGDFNPCIVCNYSDPTDYGYTAEECSSYLNGPECTNPGPALTPVGTIRTMNGIVYTFYSDLAYNYTDNVSWIYFAVKAKLPKTNKEVYFIIYPKNKEITPVTPDMIDNKKFLPTYLTSDYGSYKNSPVTNIISYREAKCIIDQGLADIMVGDINSVRTRPANSTIITSLDLLYNHFIHMAGLTSEYPELYCRAYPNTSWLTPSASSVPIKSLSIKTEKPTGMK